MTGTSPILSMATVLSGGPEEGPSRFFCHQIRMKKGRSPFLFL